MSKAFIREDSEIPEGPVVPRPNPALTIGMTNWMTADGALRLRHELHALRDKRSGSLGASAWKRALEQRVADLEYSLGTAQIVTPTGRACEEVRFGTTVTVRELGGGHQRYRIVGVDETDPDRGWVSWLSPIARTLLGKRRGDRVHFTFPAGDRLLEILEVSDGIVESASMS